MINSGVYGILNKLSGRYYIGSTKTFNRRKKDHFNILKQKKHSSYLLQNDWELDSTVFEFLILEPIINIEKLKEREQWWIDNTNSYYNICKKSDSCLGVKKRQETIEKIRLANLGLKHPQWRNDIKSKSQGGENHWTKKKKFSVESKLKMSLAHKKRALLGIPTNNRTTVYQFDLNNILIKKWDSIKNASDSLNISYPAILMCLKGKSKTSGKFIWKRNL